MKVVIGHITVVIQVILRVMMQILQLLVGRVDIEGVLQSIVMG